VAVYDGVSIEHAYSQSLLHLTNGVFRHQINGVALEISIRESGDVTRVDLRGHSTVHDGESDLLSSRLQELIASGVRNVLLNLRDLTHIDSSGISILVETYVSLKGQGGGLKLLCPCGPVLEVLTAFRLQGIIPSFEDEAQALASFRPLVYFANP
jgi:anti-anti-sigma factor